MSVPVVLNGRRTVLDCAPSAMLLDALRDGEGLTSVRATCGIGVCGACTVLLDGVPVTGCLTMAGQAAGREITTVEGLGGTDPVQRAFAAEQMGAAGDVEEQAMWSIERHQRREAVAPVRDIIQCPGIGRFIGIEHP